MAVALTPFDVSCECAGSPGADIAPVAEAVGDDMTVGFRRQVVYVSSHFVVILFQRAGIAVPLVKVPRDQDVGASPFRSVQETFREDRVLRGDGRDHAVRVLRRRHVADDLRECPRDVVAELHRRSDQVRLFEPSQFLSGAGQSVNTLEKLLRIAQSINS